MLPSLLLSLLVTASPLSTTAEQSGFQRTGRYAEVEQLCRAFPRQYPGRVRCERYGTSPEGRPLLALIASEDGTLTPALAGRKQRPVVLFQGGIHAGEIDGKDAGFWLLRDMLAGKALPGVLGQVTAVFVPVVNVDGHERFGPHQRPNQRGPEETGWRVNARNLNLNRDYAKAEAPEMVALLGLLHAWDPVLYVDLHVTDGARFEHDVAVLVEPQKAGPEALRALGTQLVEQLLPELEKRGHLPLPFYPSFRQEDDPTSGVTYGVAPARFSNGYQPVRQRLGMLVETHSWRPYPWRVETTRHLLEGVLGWAARQGPAVLAAMREADAALEAGRGREVVLAWDNTEKHRTLAFRGYAYERGPSEVSGQPWVRYDETKPQIWEMPYYDEPRPVLTVTLPAGGYLVPAAHAEWVGRKLTVHGLRFQRLERELKASVEVFRAREAKVDAHSYEGRQRLSVKGEWAKEEQVLPAGTLYVPSAQRGAHLLAHLLEPLGPDSLLAWGFFNSHFEQKEYVEDYLLESFARELLAKDAAVKAEWEARLKDTAFASSPKARLEFFYARHPARDARRNLYPVFRTDAPPEGLPPTVRK